MGLVNKVVPTKEVLPQAMEYARQICLGSPVSIKYSKKTMYETMGSSVVYPSEGWDILLAYEVITRSSKDATEGSTAFVEKRDPIWFGE
jgi:crotonobetainyl-CoA hydratase